MGGIVYLDNNATTRCDPRVVEAMLPWMTEEYGNPSSPHHPFGKRAADAVEEAREKVASLVCARRREIIFTSGATESNNLALFGVMTGHPGSHLITAATEHKSVLDTAAALARSGNRVTVLPVDRCAQVSAAQVGEAIEPGTVLATLMAASNEVGTLHPLQEIGSVCQNRGILFHTDAAQMAGKLPIDVNHLGIDLLSMSAHKMHGPKGIGALFVRRTGRAVHLQPLFHGGGQERGLRSGTLPVPLIVGFGVACELALGEMNREAARQRMLRDRLRHAIMGKLEGVSLNGHPEDRLPGNLNLSFAWVNGQALLMSLRGIAVSSGAACTATDAGPSHVLNAMGVGDELAGASLRFGLGRWTTEEEIDRAATEVVRAVSAQRQASPDYLMKDATLVRTS